MGLKSKDNSSKQTKKNDTSPVEWDKASWQYKKAYNAFHAAKARCSNPGHKSYPDYGGAGIQFHLGSFGEFIAAIGWPKSQALSLDRINPEGHYEVANIRWASAKAQQHNKKKSLGGATPSLAQYVQAAQAQAQTSTLRTQATDAWVRTVAALGRGSFTTDDVEILASYKIPSLAFQGGWDFHHIPQLADPLSYFRMPALTKPGEWITLVGGPFHCNAEVRHGTLSLLATTQSYPAGIPERLREWMREDVAEGQLGAVWVGQCSLAQLACGGVEGAMLKFASKLAKQRPVTFVPALDLAAELMDLPGDYAWIEHPSRLLNHKVLFVPDLQLDAGQAFEMPNVLANRFGSLVEYRKEYGLKTIVAVQNLSKLPQKLRSILLSRLTARDLGEVSWVPPTLHELKPNHPRYDWPKQRFLFADIRAAISGA
ncbi:hypothetical protein [Caulobacter sp. NIBR2454]|uniref:hypothetical protein n=1 Tax=Caulobacter sp. NIBR2454 TaxID=3015996 RepID=UPI0022B5F6FB|nr:hypothetical protein [Caulobacter sp. NIBR2454]